MALTGLKSLISGLYRKVHEQSNAISKQEEHVDFLNDAASLIDIELATGVTIHAEAVRLQDERHALEGLTYQLDVALDSWRGADENRSWPGFNNRQMGLSTAGSAHSEPLPVRMEQTPPESKRETYVFDNLLYNPKVGASAKYTLNWMKRKRSPKAHPAQLARGADWYCEGDEFHESHPWAEEREQLAELERREQAAIRTRSPGTWGGNGSGLRARRSFGQEVSMEPPRRKFRPFPDEPKFNDQDYDPYFWEKNQRPGNMWAPRLACAPCYQEDQISPKTVSRPQLSSGDEGMLPWPQVYEY
ncbi:hypothetical protein B0T26DRAFT_754472 [Lasiosphaeria miniovina]|uniref:Uncharacterized protein n=1 Tax=Lasiosphaeria miniovina TaxID=1954250 RepID=A0AA40A4W8_9PEZI|nr:uncharacterized protein B0T26DRAFT_754472 [Lasiosphaeria miniovina]KAK0709230.1 hypothetical protein B0T26DRAFT_754472 [Lasiosphaeria miniovina]